MKRSRLLHPAPIALAVPLVAGTALALWAAAVPGAGGRFTTARRITAGERVKLAALTVPFVVNRGQLNGRVTFYASTFAGTAFVTRNGSLVLSLPPKKGGGTHSGWTLVETPVASQPQAEHIRGVNPALTRVSVFTGTTRSHWRTGLPTYGKIDIGRPWPGISYAVTAHADNIERIFTVAPGADAGRIRIRVAGAKALRVRDRRLVAVTGNGPVTLSQPVAWQEIAGRLRTVPVRFNVSGHTYGFRLGPHEAGHAVVIDPLVQATYLGGSGYDAAADLSVAASNGNIYLAGQTTSTDFPGTGGGAQTANAGSTDAFVALLNPGLTQLIQATYLGGSGDDFASAMAIGPSGTSMPGDVYLTGDTFSTDFPGTTNGAQQNCAGTASDCTSNGDAFVAVLSADLTQLIQATYLGGTNIDDARALAIAPSGTPDAGDVYIGGRTLSTDFPGTTNGAQPQAAGSSYDGFVAELNPGLTTLLNASYLGGSGVDEVSAVLALGGSGNVYAAGNTSSTDLPCTQAGGPPPSGGACASGAASGAQPQLAGGFDAFVALFNPGLTSLTQATYLGGSDLDDGNALAVAPAGSPEAGQIYLSGWTLSSDFPGTAGGAQPQLAGNYDGFAARLAANLQSLGGATYLGGTNVDQATRLAIDAAGNVYVAGATSSTDFPCTAGNGPLPTGGSACTANHAGAQYRNGGATDGFVALLSPDLAQFNQATYFGGGGYDGVSGIGFGPAGSPLAGDVYVGGRTQSGDIPATTGGAQPAFAGVSDAYAAAVSPDLQGPQVQLDVSLSAPTQVTLGQSFQYTIVVTNNDPASGTTATNVVVTDVLNKVGPGSVVYQSATASQGQPCTELASVVTCTLGTLAPNGGSATVTITVTTGQGIAGNVSNEVDIRADQAPAAGSTITQTVVTTINPAPGSGGGGTTGPWVLVLLAALWALARARRRRSA